MSKFRLVFEVLDEAGIIVVEKSQHWVELSVEELRSESPGEGAVRVSQMEQKTIEALQTIPDRDCPLEAMRGAGEVLARFVTLRLREWSRRQ